MVEIVEEFSLEENLVQCSEMSPVTLDPKHFPPSMSPLEALSCLRLSAETTLQPDGHSNAISDEHDSLPTVAETLTSTTTELIDTETELLTEIQELSEEDLEFSSPAAEHTTVVISSPAEPSSAKLADKLVSPSPAIPVQAIEEEASSPIPQADFHMMLRSPRAYSTSASPAPAITLSPVYFDRTMQKEAFIESEFHMMLRSPKVYSNTSATKLRAKSIRKTPKCAVIEPIEVSQAPDEFDAILKDFKEAMEGIDSVPVTTRVSPKHSPVLVAPADLCRKKLIKTYRMRCSPPAEVRRSSLFNPTKSTMVRQRARPTTTAAADTTLSHCQKPPQEPINQDYRRNTMRRPTIPVTPKFQCEERSRKYPKILTTEEREIEELKEAKRAEEVRVQNAKKMFEWVRRHSSAAVLKSKKELTVPTTPVSYLRSRMGNKKCSIETGIVVKEEAKRLDSVHNKGPTQFEPFQFATDVRRSMKTGDASVKKRLTPGAAEAEFNFFKDPRSHGAPKGYTLHPTAPVTPHFKTDVRAQHTCRPLPLSYEEQEEALLLEMQSHSFKAKPVNKRIFQSMGELGVPKVPARKVTDIAPFELKCMQRTRTLVMPTDSEIEAAFKFKARPMPSYQDTSTRSHVPPQKLTVALSPKLSGSRATSAPERRQRQNHKVVEEEKRIEVEKALHPTPARLTLTDPKEFHLHTSDRGLAHRAQREQRLRQEQAKEAEARHIRAIPAPVLTKPYQVVPSSRELTEFHEFKLQSLVRHSFDLAAQEKQSHELDEISTQKMHFQARSLPRSTFEPDVNVEIENKPLTIARPVYLESENRAEKRREFDVNMAQKLAELGEQKEAAARRKLLAENRKIKKMRHLSVDQGGMSFKAGPVIKKDLYPTRYSQPAPLTEPKSPTFHAMIHRENELAAALEEM